MTATRETTADPRALPASGALLGTIPETLLSSGSEALDRLRRAAKAEIARTGLPSKRTEAFRFTPLSDLANTPYLRRAPEREAFHDAQTLPLDLRNNAAPAEAELLSVDGALARSRGGLSLPAGLHVMSLGEAIATGSELIARALGQFAKSQYFAALNTIFFEDVVIVQVRAGARFERPLRLVHVVGPAGWAAPAGGTLSGESSEPKASYPRTLIVMGEGSEMQLVESYIAVGKGDRLSCPVTEVLLDDGAILDHVRVVEGVSDTSQLGTLAVRVGQDGRYASRVATFGGKLSRLDLEVELAGRGAECTLDGVYLVDTREHVDHHTRIDHVSSDATSVERYKGVLDGNGSAVFDGTIVVHRDAQRSNAHQENRNLLLSDDATVHTKPHLEIDADDVKCSHGATVGTLDDDQLYYLRARGIDEASARGMLTFAFVRELLAGVRHEATRRHLEHLVANRLLASNPLSVLALTDPTAFDGSAFEDSAFAGSAFEDSAFEGSAPDESRLEES